MNEDEYGVPRRSPADLCTEIGADEPYGNRIGGRYNEIRRVGDAIHIQTKGAVGTREWRGSATIERAPLRWHLKRDRHGIQRRIIVAQYETTYGSMLEGSEFRSGPEVAFTPQKCDGQ